MTYKSIIIDQRNPTDYGRSTRNKSPSVGWILLISSESLFHFNFLLRTKTEFYRCPKLANKQWINFAGEFSVFGFQICAAASIKPVTKSTQAGTQAGEEKQTSQVQITGDGKQRSSGELHLWLLKTMRYSLAKE